AAVPARDVAPVRAAAGDTLPRPVPLEEGTWPLAPEPAPKIEPMLRVETPSESRPRPPRSGAAVEGTAASDQVGAAAIARGHQPRSDDPLAGLAEELSRV